MKKLLTILLAVTMITSLFALPAAAQPEQALPGITGMTWEGQGGWWASLDEAALAWADVFVPHQHEQYREFGAIIYRSFSWRNFRWGYTFSQTVRGEEYMVMPLPPAHVIRRPFRAAGSIHTHPYWSSNHFSGGDLDSAHAWQSVAHFSYVAGPQGCVRRYDARTREFELVRNNMNPQPVLDEVAWFNQAHGGTGELIATVTAPQEVTITGHVTDAQSNLWFGGFALSDITIRLNATIIAHPSYSSSLISDSRNESKIYIDGGLLQSNGNAIVTNNITSTLTINGGEIVGGVIASGRLNFFDGTVNTASSRLQANAIYISPQAQLTTPNPPWITMHTNADFTTMTVIEESFSWRPQTIYLRPGDTLIIEESASLDVGNWGSIFLLGGTLVIDGELLGEIEIVRGTITGQNAGELAGTHAPWYDRLPGWLDFFLRYFTFGFLWFGWL